MSQSCLVVPPYRRIRHAELTPVQPRESTYKTHHDVKSTRQHFNSNATNQLKAPKRAFSMTRLDQLAKPRQRYLEEALKLRASKTKENLCYSVVRPTSSMSLASSKQQSSTNNTPSTPTTNTNTSRTANNNQSPFNNSNQNNGTILLRQRTSARKQRPISYAGYTSSINRCLSPNQENNNLNATFNRSSVKAKQTFNNCNNRNLNSSSSSNSHSRNLMVSSIDGSMLGNLLNKPTPPKKPSHIKAVSAARKLAKQQDSKNLIDLKSDRIKKSDSSSRISNQLERNVDGTKDRMKKSITNPEGIAELLLDEPINLRDELNGKSNLRTSIKTENLNLLVDDKSNDHLNENADFLKSTDLDRTSTDHQFKSTTELDNMSNSTYIVDVNDKSSDQVSQHLFDFTSQGDKNAELSTKCVNNDQVDELIRNELKIKNEIDDEDEQEKKRLENEEMKRRAQDEEKKRLAREEKERELERKVKEKAEKARLEMEERLRKDEQERIERKKVNYLFKVIFFFFFLHY